MENDPFKFGSWGEFMYKLLKELDPRYVARDGAQKLINMAVIGFITILCSTVLGGLFGIFTGLIHLP